ncbi:MAG: acetyl-CoA carboxylase biotin carboxyl carrier protein [Cyclobacteriaceae bacterium]|nr:acetyl-CoA carboxylase biotin carboxyl carrier protein [Cyclobacteriaceae bacterium]
MKAKEIRDLIDFISSSGLDEVNIETQEFKISVKKNTPVINNTIAEAPGAVASSPKVFEAPAVAAPSITSSIPETQSSEEESKYIEIKSPMIGTFYITPSPDAEDFVKIGDIVKVGQTVCIVEAMKLFNEIESEYSGKIVKVLVENASPVEFDQPLFLVDPS